MDSLEYWIKNSNCKIDINAIIPSRTKISLVISYDRFSTKNRDIRHKKLVKNMIIFINIPDLFDLFLKNQSNVQSLSIFANINYNVLNNINRIMLLSVIVLQRGNWNKKLSSIEHQLVLTGYVLTKSINLIRASVMIEASTLYCNE